MTFLVAVTATFRLLYVFVVIEHRSRRRVHYNVTSHPPARWTLQQRREAVGFETRYTICSTIATAYLPNTSTNR